LGLPRLSGIKIQFGCLNGIDQCPHITLGNLRVGQDVATLLIEDTRDPVARTRKSVSARVKEAEACTDSRLLCSLNAIGASGSMMIWHVFGTLTSRIAFRLILFEVDLEPSVATSL